MKFASIPPIAYLDNYSTKYHLALAHLCLESEIYRNFYWQRRKRGEFVILDNGCAEKGSSISSEQLVMLAFDIRPNVLVCPDVLRDTDATLTATNRFLDRYAARLKALNIDLMAVPQGTNAIDWDRSFIWFNADPTISWLGISKYVVGAFPTRLAALRLIDGRVRKKCHLLGMVDDPLAVVDERKFRFVKSTDSAIPVKMGMQGLTLDDWPKYKRMTDDTYFYTNGLEDHLIPQILSNIRAYEARCS